MDTATIQAESPVALFGPTEVVDDLIDLYIRIDKSAGSMPYFSAIPFIVLLWSTIKCELLLFADVVLIVPVNIVVFVRNFFPGRWSYKCFCCRYFKVAWRWLWIGETIPPAIVLRPLVTSLLHWHFRSRVLALRRQISLSTDPSEDRAAKAYAKIERALSLWGNPVSGKLLIFGWFLPLLGPVNTIWSWLAPIGLVPSPSWSRFTIIISISYALSTLSAAFAVKRGLMLGGIGGAAFYPGLISGAWGYERERNILSAVGLESTEFPLDLVVLVGSYLFSLVANNVLDEFMNRLGVVTPEWERQWLIPINLLTLSIFVVLPWLRRRKLNRS